MLPIILAVDCRSCC